MAVTDYKQESISLFQNVMPILEALLTGFQRLHYTLETMREDYFRSDWATPLNASLENGVVKVVAAHTIAIHTLHVLLHNADETSERNFQTLCELWDQIRDDLESSKSEIIVLVGEFIGWEMERAVPYIGTASFFNMHFLAELENMTEAEIWTVKNVLVRFNGFLDYWSRTVYLFLRYLPQYLDPLFFFHTSNGFYLYFSDIVERMLTMAHLQRNEHNKHMLWLAKSICMFGYIGPPSQLAADIRNITFDMDVDDMSLSQLVELIKINPKKFDYQSKAKRFEISMEPYKDFFSTERLLQLFNIIMSDVVDFTGDLYLMLRRSTFYFLNMVFPKEMLMPKGLELLFTDAGVSWGLQCKHLQEILRKCSEHIKTVIDFGEEVEAKELQHSLHSVYENILLSVDDKLEKDTWLVRNLAVSTMVTTHYLYTKEKLLENTARFVKRFAECLAYLNIKPQQAGNTYTLFKRYMHVYKGMCEELERAVIETDRDVEILVALRCTDTAEHILNSYFDSLINDFPMNERQPDELSVVWILQSLPLHDEVRAALKRTVQGLTVTGKEPRLTTLTLKGSSPYFYRQVINMDTTLVPDEDIVTPEEILQLFALKKEHELNILRFGPTYRAYSIQAASAEERDSLIITLPLPTPEVPPIGLLKEHPTPEEKAEGFLYNMMNRLKDWFAQ